MNDHIAGEDLAAFVDGTLQGAAKAELESHLSRCPECRAALAEIVDIQGRRARIPADFLRRALQAVPPRTGAEAGEDAWRAKARPARALPPMRLVFGIAAVVLVVVLIGIYFLDHGRLETAGLVDREMPLPAAAAEAQRSPAPGAGAGRAQEEKAAGTLVARKSRDQAGDDRQREKKSAVAKAEPVRPAASPIAETGMPAPLPGKAERPRPLDEKDAAPPGETQGGAVGGVLGGIAAQPDADKESKAKRAAASPASGAGLEELGKNDAGILSQAATAGRSKGAAPEEGSASRSRLPAASASADAMQLFLAATGHAASPPAAAIADLEKRPAILISGDVSRADLSDPGLLDSWSWFPPGRALRLEIDAAGAVAAVVPVGTWDERAAALAQAAARELRFPPSGKEMRRAVLSAPAPPNGR